jgi:hypothetical protein
MPIVTVAALGVAQRKSGGLHGAWYPEESL